MEKYFNEAKRLEIPVVSIVDTNTDPNIVDYPIPANDDSIRALKLIISQVSKTICEKRSIEYPDSISQKIDQNENLSNKDDNEDTKIDVDTLVSNDLDSPEKDEDDSESKGMSNIENKDLKIEVENDNISDADDSNVNEPDTTEVEKED